MFRCRTQAFLDRANAELFEPRGLFATIMTFKPEQQSQIVPIDSSSLSAAIASGAQRFRANRIRNDPNTTYGDLQLPPSAPLVYLDLVRATSASGKRNDLRGMSHFVADYFDRRAQAEYVRQSFRLESNVFHFSKLTDSLFLIRPETTLARPFLLALSLVSAAGGVIRITQLTTGVSSP